MHQLIQVLEKLVRPRIALVGDFMLDRYVYGDAERISPEAPVPVVRVVAQESRPGGAGSVAANILALGGGVHCVGVVGRDAAGEELCALLKGLGADTSGLVCLSDRPTTRKQRIIGLAQHRHRQQMLRLDEEAVGPLPEEVLATLRANLRGVLRDCQAVALEDYDKGVLSGALTAQLIADACAAGVPVLVDPARVADYSRYRGCTLLTPNRDEAELASGAKITDQPSMALAAEKLMTAADCAAVVITLDKQGAYLARRGQAGLLVGTRPRTVYDVTGAGDAVLAMLAVALAGGADLPSAVALANVAGGLEVERFGVVPISRQDVLGELLLIRKATSGKVMTQAEMVAEVRRLLGAGQRVVFTNGCFDLLHAGHVQYLSFARSQGDVLIVGLNSDESVRRNKGPHRPVVGQSDRAAVLAALESVDYVCIFEQDTPAQIIDAIAQGPIVLVKGEDWREKGVVGRETVEARGGKVVLAPLVPGHSTTGLMERISGEFGPQDR